MREPTPHRVAVGRQCRSQHRAVRLDTPLVRLVACDDDPPTHRSSLPATLGRDPTRKTSLAIERAHQLIDVDDLRLQLDEQERASRRMERQDVDGTTFPVDRERDLGCELPAGETRKVRGDRLMQCRVPRAEEPGKLTAAPACNEIDPDVECTRHRSQSSQRRGAEVTALDVRDERPRNARPNRHVFLSPSPSNSHGANRRADPHVIHRDSIAGVASRALSGGLAGTCGQPSSRSTPVTLVASESGSWPTMRARDERGWA